MADDGAEKGARDVVFHRPAHKGNRVQKVNGGPPIRRGQSRKRHKGRGWLLAAGGCVPLLAVVFVVKPPGTEHAADAASVTGQGSTAGVTQGGTAQAGGWGRGGYPMMGGGVANAANAAVTSTNWSGYAAHGAAGTFTSVSSSWTQPAVTCGAQQTFSSFWVGLDGDGTQTVEQTGTEADCSNGAATYQGWWEMFPNAPVFYSNPVAPGDAMSASVVANGGGAFTLTLSDQTAGWTQTTQQTSATAQLDSAEVIAEAPSNGTVLPLSNFGTVSFANSMVNNAAVGNANPDSLTMVSAAGVTEATPSALTNGENFTVTWDSSGTAAAGAGTGAATPTGVTSSTSPSAAATPSASPAP
jgi:hypothetical protein